jgi:NitT/TauT family transport system substrate-binding protein
VVVRLVCFVEPHTHSEIRLAVTSGTPLVAPVYESVRIARSKPEGVQIRTMRLMLGRACLEALLAGHADIATVAETPLAYAAAQGYELEVLATLGYSSEHIRVVARKSHGVLTPRDLVGKTIATALGTVHEYYLDRFLAEHSIDKRSVNIVNYDPLEMARAVASETVSAAVLWSPHTEECRRHVGEDLTIFPSGGYFTTYYSLVAKRGFSKRNPEQYQQFVNLLKDAAISMRATSKESLRVLGAELPAAIDTLAEIWPRYHFAVDRVDELQGELSRQIDWIAQKDPRAAARAHRHLATFFE